METLSENFRSIWGLWLMMIFLSAVFFAYRPRNRQRFEEAASIPLNDDLPDAALLSRSTQKQIPSTTEKEVGGRHG